MKLDTFMRMAGQEYFIIRGGHKLPDKVDGLPNGDENGEYIGFYPETDVQPGDCVEHTGTGERLYIHDTKYQFFTGKKPIQLKGYYWTEAQYQQQQKQNTPSASFVFHGPVTNSIVGTQENATLSVQIENLYQEIEKRGESDIDELKKMLDEVKTALEQGEIKAGSLNKFADLLAKHSWITGPLNTVLLKMAFGV